ncbi:uncharacterized protein LOC123507769 isoform X1 [Portunus trituberculatus]|uniref:uncharacterized protein LOC123507769 isoform X1 n=1 Tax=Portunus trituberculatus TaxID=210409 RepID=UPI001E1CB401|nr:uncharacterized protein LOC123507769 isoform X1 [Portunus trituberculatus]XP_045116888.1 uncharacterized protein LOC123507769 isoform X1 [Portunus trituberculatus]
MFFVWRSDVQLLWSLAEHATGIGGPKNLQRSRDSCTLREGIWLRTAFTDPFPLPPLPSPLLPLWDSASQRIPAARQTPATTTAIPSASAVVQRGIQLRIAHLPPQQQQQQGFCMAPLTCAAITYYYWYS